MCARIFRVMCFCIMLSGMLTGRVYFVFFLCSANNRLVDHVSSEIDKFFHVNVKKSPFMSGLLFYFVLLVPVLTVNVLLIRLIQTTMKFTITHFVILISTYFFLTCVGCSLSSVLLKSDVNLYLMSHHRRFYYVVLLGMTIIYLWHLGLVGLQLFITKDRLELSQFVASLCIALHYFLFVWRPSFLDSKSKHPHTHRCTCPPPSNNEKNLPHFLWSQIPARCLQSLILSSSHQNSTVVATAL